MKVKVSTGDYIQLRRRFFGESHADAIEQTRALATFVVPALGLRKEDVLRLAADALLVVDAANARWVVA